MKNIDVIRQMPLEKLAKALVRLDHEEEWDYDWEEEPFYWGLQEIYVTSDGERFMYEEDAVEHEIWWLQAEKGATEVRNEQS